MRPQRASAGGRVSREEVAAIIRRDILSGAFAPGRQIPTREELAGQLGASYVTVQRGLDQLRQEGFINSRRGCGTFVVQHPPHLFHYGLVIPPDPPADSPGHSRYRALMAAEADLIASEMPPRRVTTWRNVECHEDNKPYQDLLRMVRHRCVAGLIFPNSPRGFIGSPLVDSPHIGLAMVGTPEPDIPHATSFRPDIHNYFCRACQELAQRGRKRAAVLYPAGVFREVKTPSVGAYLHEELARAGLATRPWWHLPLNPKNGEGVRQVTRLLLEQPPADRPDCLILLDDHHVLPATQAAVDSGLDVPRELGIIAYCNFPAPPKAVVPVRRLGFDMRRLFRDCLRAIDLARLSGPVGSDHLMAAMFEEELPYPLGDAP